MENTKNLMCVIVLTMEHDVCTLLSSILSPEAGLSSAGQSEVLHQVSQHRILVGCTCEYMFSVRGLPARERLEDDELVVARGDACWVECWVSSFHIRWQLAGG